MWKLNWIIILCVFVFVFVFAFHYFSFIECDEMEGMIGTVDQKCQVRYGEGKKYLVRKMNTSYCCVTNQYDISNCKQK